MTLAEAYKQRLPLAIYHIESDVTLLIAALVIRDDYIGFAEYNWQSIYDPPGSRPPFHIMRGKVSGNAPRWDVGTSGYVFIPPRDHALIKDWKRGGGISEAEQSQVEKMLIENYLAEMD